MLLEIFSHSTPHPSPPPPMKMSNSALVSPSVNIKLQQIFTAYRGIHRGDDNKEVWGSNSALSLPFTSLHVGVL